VYRGTAYDLTAFVDRHPAGSWLINLALGRDCTALFESYHLRPEVRCFKISLRGAQVAPALSRRRGRERSTQPGARPAGLLA
jgi:cytochrome b involved in lipid metabolism